MLDTQGFLGFRHEIVADLFAGGGGASEGIKQALGRCPDVAVNHNADAILMHESNHPNTAHYISDVFAINPKEVTRNQPVGLAWFSPDCKHFSKAKGSKPVSKKIRGLAWDAVRWAREVKPRVICLENVEEFLTWGPLGKDGTPIKGERGVTFERWVGCLKAAGYVVEWRVLRACDYGAPTIRKRLFVVARCDGRPIVWPKATHGKTRGLKPFRTAAECLDFNLPCHSIFLSKDEARKVGVKRPLAPATLRRIWAGMDRFVINCADPFIVNTRNGERAGQDPRVRSINEPAWTVTSQGSQSAIVTPIIVPVSHSGDARVHDVQEPLRTVQASSRGNLSMVAAHITKFRTGSVGSDAGEPLHTICAGGDMVRDAGAAHAMGLVEAHLAAPIIVGIDNKSNGARDAWSAEEPLRTTTVENRFAAVAAFLSQHNTGMVGHDVRKPLSTSTAKRGPQMLNIITLEPYEYRDENCAEADQRGTDRGALGRDDMASAKSRSKRQKRPTQNRDEIEKRLSIGEGIRGRMPLPLGSASVGVDCPERSDSDRTSAESRGWEQGEQSSEQPDSRDGQSECRTRVAHGTAHTFGDAEGARSGGEAPEGSGPFVSGNRGEAGYISNDSIPLDANELTKANRVYAFLMSYYSSGDCNHHSLKKPMPTVRTKDGLGLVLVKVEGHYHAIIDICMRMLAPSELFLAQGFPASYNIRPSRDGKPITATAQVRMVGNSVCPPVAAALVRANFKHETQYRAAA